MPGNGVLIRQAIRAKTHSMGATVGRDGVTMYRYRIAAVEIPTGCACRARDRAGLGEALEHELGAVAWSDLDRARADRVQSFRDMVSVDLRIRRGMATDDVCEAVCDVLRPIGRSKRLGIDGWPLWLHGAGGLLSGGLFLAGWATGNGPLMAAAGVVHVANAVFGQYWHPDIDGEQHRRTAFPTAVEFRVNRAPVVRIDKPRPGALATVISDRDRPLGVALAEHWPGPTFVWSAPGLEVSGYPPRDFLWEG